MFSPRQNEFISDSTAKFNLAHGSVRSGKTVCTLYRFMCAVRDCPGSKIWMIGLTSDTLYHNIIRLLFESDELSFFRFACTWTPGKRELTFMDKTINTLGARDERAIGPIQGKTFDLCYCDEMTLYPESVLQMISTRLSMPHSQLFGSMNPMQPSHIVKQWIDAGDAGDKNFYSLHFNIDHNPFLPPSYKEMLKATLSGLFYRRNYLGEWCLADGAIFDFLDKKIHIVKRPPRAAEFWLVGIDYGASNPFAAVLVGYSSGKYEQAGAHMWVEKEYYWDPKKQGRQKTNSEFARDLQEFIEGYSIRSMYLDPSAESFQVELRRMNIHVVHANNDVYNGIQLMTNLVKEGSLTICESCPNLIREMEGYVWDQSKSKQGIDAPLKQADHALDALRYVCASFMKGRRTLKIQDPDEIYRKQQEQIRQQQWGANGAGWQ